MSEKPTGRLFVSRIDYKSDQPKSLTVRLTSDGEFTEADIKELHDLLGKIVRIAPETHE